MRGEISSKGFQRIDESIKSSLGLCFFPGTLPKPFLRALPIFVPAESNVTLRCWMQVKNVEFIFSNGSIPLPSKSMVSVDVSGRTVEVPLVHLHQQDSGKYACKYFQTEAPHQCPLASDVLSWLQVRERRVSASCLIHPSLPHERMREELRREGTK